MNAQLVGNLIWTLGAGVLGFIITAIAAGKYELSRSKLVGWYVVLAGGFFYAFLRWNGVNLIQEFTDRWIWGLVAAVFAGAIAINNVLSQPSYQRERGFKLVADLTWNGIVYGLIDGLFLSVLPVLAIWKGFSEFTWADGLGGQVLVGLIAILASLYITALYHLGYPEFRGKEVLMTLLGNGIFSLAYLVSLNPISATVAHVGMHVAAVTKGKEKTIQLPPHYPNEEKTL